MSWTDERIGLLKKMWKDGKSAAEIAKTLGKGVTRNAVIGKAHRMGLSGRPSPIKKPVPAAKKETPKKEVVKNIAKKLAVAETRPVKASPFAREPEPLKKPLKEIAPLNGGIPLVDLSERMCKWPIGDPRDDDFTFCGHPIRVGTPYCPGHAAAAYQTSSRRGQHAVVAAPANEDKEVDEKVEEDAVDDVEEEV